jgi:glycerol-3-phosphate acyltransferase PlsY
MTEAALIAVAYLLGSLPFAFLLSRRRGIDLRRVGSGNVGATNVLRAAGVGRAMAVLVLDGGKGAAAVLLAARISGGGVAPLAAGLASIAGHVYPVWLGFRGGKGVATTAGVFAVLAPGALVAAAGAFVAAVWATRYVSVGSLVGAGTLVVVTALSATAPTALAASVAAVVVVHRHRGNVVRLRAGTERRVGLRLPASAAPGDGDGW